MQICSVLMLPSLEHWMAMGDLRSASKVVFISWMLVLSEDRNLSLVMSKNNFGIHYVFHEWGKEKVFLLKLILENDIAALDCC